MSRYIDADELHNRGWVAARFTNWEPTPFNSNFRLEAEVKPFITFPAADVQEVRHGRWIKNDGRYGWHCSVCGEDDLYAFSWNSDTGENELQDHYCPNCGAKMEGEEE